MKSRWKVRLEIPIDGNTHIRVHLVVRMAAHILTELLKEKAGPNQLQSKYEKSPSFPLVQRERNSHYKARGPFFLFIFHRLHSDIWYWVLLGLFL